MLDDAIRDHLELKRRHGAAHEEVSRLEEEAFGAAGAPARAPEPTVEEPPVAAELQPVVLEPEPLAAEPAAAEPEPAAAEPEPTPPPVREEPEAWLDEPDEVPAQETLEHDTLGEPPGEEDVLEETPEFLQETPDHDRLWFEQKPPRDFDFDN